MYDLVYVIGVFDLFHRGHVELLRRSRALGKRLLVALNSDRLVAEYKGRRPIFPQDDRLAIVQACRHVDEAFVIDSYDNRDVLLRHGVSAVVHGDDWSRASYLEQIRVTEGFLAAHHVDLVFLPYTSGVSTSDYLKRIREDAP